MMMRDWGLLRDLIVLSLGASLGVVFAGLLAAAKGR